MRNKALFKQGRRKCSGPCHKVRQLRFFHRDKSRPNGYSSTCISCKRKYYEANKALYRQRAAESRARARARDNA